MQSDRKSGSPTSPGKEGNSGERIAANSRSQSPELPTTSARSQSTQVLLEQVATAANGARQRFTARITQGTEAIATSIQQQQAALIAAGEQQTGAIQALFASARAQVGEIITSAQAQLQTDATSHLANLEQGHTTTLGQVETAFSSGQERVQNLGNTYAERSLQTADESAQQVQTRVQRMAQESRALGQEKAQVGGSTPEIAQAKAKAANEIASDTATKITSGVSDAMRDLRATGPETARGFREQSQEAARQVGAGQAEVVNQLNTSNQQTASGIQQAVTQGSQALGNLGTQLTAQLASLEQTIQNQLQTQIGQKSQKIYQAGQQAITTFQQQGQQAIASGDEHLAQFNQQLAGMDVDPDLAAEVSGEVVGQVNGAYDNLIATTDGAFQQADGALTQAGTEVINAINGISTNASGQIQTFLGQAQGQVTQQVGAISSQLGTTVTQANTAGSGMVSQIATSLSGQIGQIESGFKQGLEQYRGGLNEQVASAEDRVREPRQDLPNRIDTAQRRAEERSKQGFWERQWNDFVEMVSDPGFLAGLITGLLLAALVIFVVGTGGLGLLAILAIGAVIGAISAGVGTFVSQITGGSYSNLFSGNVSLSRVDWGQIGINMALGAAFGAGLAAAEFLGATVIGLSVAAGFLTFISNIATGQPWDKNLLANMALTGLFARLMKTKAARALTEKIGNSSRTRQVETNEETTPYQGIKLPSGTRTIEVESSNIKATEPRLVNGEWQYALYDKASGAEFCWIEVEATASGTPKGGPHLTLLPRAAKIPATGESVVLEPRGGNFKWTDVSLRAVIDAFEAKFGHRPANMDGLIAWGNLENFQSTFAQIRDANPGMPIESVAEQAARQISFGTHRIALGYGDISVKFGNFGDVTLTTGKIAGHTLSNVPKHVYIYARPTGSPPIIPPPQIDRNDSD
jgi:F0F1-type ATP synthase assembly protein I